MIIYNVTVSVDYSAHDEWLNWMKQIHIPEVMETGKFIDCKMSKILADEEGGKSYSIQYLCKNMEVLESYQENEAPALQQKHSKLFGGKTHAFRTILEVVHHEK
jgi:hypothetical protein